MIDLNLNSKWTRLMNYELESSGPMDNLHPVRVLEHRLGSWIKQMNDSFKDFDFLNPRSWRFNLVTDTSKTEDRTIG